MLTLGASKAKGTVCLNLFATLDQLEIVTLDLSQQQVDRTAALPFAFDATNREVIDPDGLKDVIKSLYDIVRVPLSTPTVIVLPSFFTRELLLPESLDEESIQLSLTSEAERFYIFKKYEPQVDWIELGNNAYLYSAFTKQEINQLLHACQNLNIPVVGIDLNYFSIHRGLMTTGAISDEMTANALWCLMVVGNQNFYACLYEGNRILRTTEAPLSSIENENELPVVQEIQQDFQRFLDGEPFQKLILVNNANIIHTDTLMSEVCAPYNTLVIEQSEQTLRSRGASQGLYPCSLEGIGGVFYQQIPELPAMNFMPMDSKQKMAEAKTQKQLMVILVALNILFFAIGLAIWGSLALWAGSKNSELEKINQEISSAQAGTNLPEVEKQRFIKTAVDRNTKNNDLVVRLGALATGDLWLTQVKLQVIDPRKPETQVEITGRSLSPEPVSELQNKLKETLSWQNLEVDNVNLVNSDSGQPYYEWGLRTPPPKTP